MKDQPMITVRIDSLANIKSCNSQTIPLSILGAESWEEWDNWGEDDQYKAVEEYWATQCAPEISWDEKR